MRKERLNGWPDRSSAPELWTHNLYVLFKRLGVDPETFDPRSPVAPALKMMLYWRRDHGYSIGGVPMKFANDACEAAFGSNGVAEWVADRYQLII